MNWSRQGYVQPFTGLPKSPHILLTVSVFHCRRCAKEVSTPVHEVREMADGKADSVLVSANGCVPGVLSPLYGCLKYTDQLPGIVY